MGAQALKFSSLLNRLRMVGARVVMSLPAPAGSVWIFGKQPGPFPFAKGPMYPMKARSDDDLIPGRMVEKILKHLELDGRDCAMFWDIIEHEHTRDQATQA